MVKICEAEIDRPKIRNRQTTIRDGDFSIPLSETDRSGQQKINEDGDALNRLSINFI